MLVIAEAVSNSVDQPIVKHALNPMNWIHSRLRFLETFMEPLWQKWKMRFDLEWQDLEIICVHHSNAQTVNVRILWVEI